MEYFSSNSTLAMGFLAGILFGFLLRKGLVTRFDTIVGQFLLKDFTMIKIMMSAIVVGSIGVWGMHEVGFLQKLPIKEAVIIANIVGGIIVGVGMAILAIVPWYLRGAVGEGSIDGLFGLFGMLLGAALFAEIYDGLQAFFFEPLNLGKMTLPSLTGWSPWVFIALLAIVFTIFFIVLERYEKNLNKKV